MHFHPLLLTGLFFLLNLSHPFLFFFLIVAVGSSESTMLIRPHRSGNVAPGSNRLTVCAITVHFYGFRLHI